MKIPKSLGVGGGGGSPVGGFHGVCEPRLEVIVKMNVNQEFKIS